MPKKNSNAAYATEAHIPVLEKATADAVSIPFGAVRIPAGANSLKAILRDHGFAIVTGVLDAQEIQHGEALWGQDLTSILSTRHSLDQKAVTALTQDPVHRWPATLPLGTKFASDFGLPQGRLGWWVRQHANARRVYEALHDTNDLIVGMDNIFFNPRPLPEGTDLTSVTSALWPHADQNLHLKPEGDWDVYQGVMYLWGAAADTSATVVWPGSHRGEYDQLMAERGASSRGHFVMMKKSDYRRFAQGARRVPVPPGAMLLWSSRTIHQGWPNGPRLAVPVCFEPRGRRVDKSSYGQKMQCVVDGIPTSHWASLGKAHSCASKPQPVVKFDCGMALEHKAHEHALSDAGINESILSLL